MIINKIVLSILTFEKLKKLRKLKWLVKFHFIHLHYILHKSQSINYSSQPRHRYLMAVQMTSAVPYVMNVLFYNENVRMR